MSDDVWLLIVGVVPLVVGILLAVYEVFRRADLPVPKKVLWLVTLFVLPTVGLGLYAVLRPPRHRAAIATAQPGSRRAAAIVGLVEQHVNGDLDDAAYRTELAAVRSAGQNS